MRQSRLSDKEGARARLSCRAVFALGAAIAAAACSGAPQPSPDGASGKGPELQGPMNQTPRPDGASQMSRSSPTSDAATPAPAGCGQGLPCTGPDGCVGACDPATNLVTACAACDNTTFTDCTQSACRP